MSKLLVVFPDVQSAGAAVLRDALAVRAEPHAAGAAVGTKVPAVRAPEDPLLPFVMVRKDSDVTRYPVNARCTLRVTVWHTTADMAHDLAQLCHGLLLVHDGTVLRSVRPGTGPIAATDPDSNVDLSTFTVIANVRPSAVA